MSTSILSQIDPKIILTNDQREALELIVRGTEEIISINELAKKIASGKSLIIKAGFDPTAPDIHLGHTVLLRKMAHFQKLGHQVHFLIGDFTAMIGDPTGKSKTRKRLTREEVLLNAESYKEQVFKILDKEKTKVVFNSAWCANMSFGDVLELTSHYTVARMLERDDFQNRYRGGQPISMLEMMYPLVQGYDSVAMKADVELGGTDQKFNLLVGRDLMKEFGEAPQVCITMPILEGLDGVNKMSKSLNNYIGIFDSPSEMYGKVMSIPDTLITRYFTLLTDVPFSNISKYEQEMKSGTNPRDIKNILGKAIVAQYHSEGAAEQAAQEFITIFSKGGLPDDIAEVVLPNSSLWIVDLIALTKHCTTNGEIRRLIQGGGVSLGDAKVGDDKAQVSVEDGTILKLGKRGFYKLRIR